MSDESSSPSASLRQEIERLTFPHYFHEGRCTGGSDRWNGRYCRDAAGPEEWCINCAGFVLQQRLTTLQGALKAKAEAWEQKADRYEADGQEMARDAGVGVVHPAEWEASRLRDCAAEVRALLTPSAGSVCDPDNHTWDGNAPSNDQRCVCGEKLWGERFTKAGSASPTPGEEPRCMFCGDPKSAHTKKEADWRDVPGCTGHYWAGKTSRYLLDYIPSALWRKARAKAKRQGLSMRTLILRLLQRWSDEA